MLKRKQTTQACLETAPHYPMKRSVCVHPYLWPSRPYKVVVDLPCGQHAGPSSPPPVRYNPLLSLSVIPSSSFSWEG